jgi:class 3 adenylate cyclase
MPEFVDWLKTLGMSEYAERFAENRIDLSVLRHLNDQDLKDLGVAALGDRRKMLSAISELTGTAPRAGPGPPVPTAPTSQDIAERRQLTVMFCDLVGSTALAACMDPEDLREVISAYQNACTKVIQAKGGLVAKYMGDGILAYFGYPRAHEDDAERSVRAGLDIIQAVSALKTRAPEPPQVRIGIGRNFICAMPGEKRAC